MLYAGKCGVGIADFGLVKGANKDSFMIADASIFIPSKEAIDTICDALHFPRLVQ
jgi:hypothetical protein